MPEDAINRQYTATHSPVQEWIEKFHDEELNDVTNLMGENFQYLIDHTTEYNEGELQPSDLPALRKSDKFLQYFAAIFGTEMAADGSSVYAVSRVSDGAFIGLYGTEKNALQRTTEQAQPEDPPLTTEEHKIIDASPVRLIREFERRDHELTETLSVGAKFFYEHQEEVFEGEVTPDDLPAEIDENTRWFLVYSILFGILWEYSYPHFIGVFDGNRNQLLNIYRRDSTADNIANNSPRFDDVYSQPLTLADGYTPTEDVLD